MKNNKQWWFLAKRMILATGLTFLLGTSFSPVMEKYSQSFKFVDEAEHMVMGWLMGKGYRLYKNFPNNHQPISYLASYTVHQTNHMDNVFMLVRRHRQAIFLWSAIWWVILFSRFGAGALIPLAIFENVKYFILGNLFLAESIVVYPLAFLAGSLLTTSKKRTTGYDHFFYGLLTAFIQFTLLPMAPTLIMLTLIWLLRFKGKGILPFGVGILTILVLVFWFINPIDYIIEVKNAILFSLPGLTPFETPWDYAKLIGLPFLYIPLYKEIMGQIVIFMLWLWLVAIMVYLTGKRFKLALFTFGFFIAWLMTNMREVEINLYFYRGFHLIPWFLIGLMGGLLSYLKAIRLLPKSFFWGINTLTALGCVIILTNHNLPWYTNINPDTDHYIQYTPLNEIAQTINSYKLPEDRLMVIPNASWLYFMTDLQPAETNMFTFYDWQMQVPKNRTMFFNTLEHQPPAFIVYNDDGSSYSPVMNEYLKHNYQLITQQYQLNLYINNELKKRVE